MPILPLSGAASAKGALVPIASYTFPNSTLTAFSFTNIPQIYQDLFISISYNYTLTGANLAGNLPGQTSTSHSSTSMHSTGSTAPSGRLSSFPYAMFVPISVTDSNTSPQTAHIHFFNYADTVNYKTYLVKWAQDMSGYNSTVGYQVGVSRVSNAITEISFSTANGSVFFRQGSTAQLYGVRSIGQ